MPRVRVTRPKWIRQELRRKELLASLRQLACNAALYHARGKTVDADAADFMLPHRANDCRRAGATEYHIRRALREGADRAAEILRASPVDSPGHTA